MHVRNWMVLQLDKLVIVAARHALLADKIDDNIRGRTLEDHLIRAVPSSRPLRGIQHLII
jgi:hypothetical protein